MRDAFGSQAREVGHKTMGHVCIGPEDLKAAKETASSLLFGEILPEGVTKMMHHDRLNGRAATSLVDLGSGTGKLCLQCFLQFENLATVEGVEISPSRYRIGEEALLRLARARPRKFRVSAHSPGSVIHIVTERTQSGSAGKIAMRGNDGRRAPCLRTLTLRAGDMFTASIASSDLLVLEVAMGGEFVQRLRDFLWTAKPGARILSYLDLRRTFVDAQILSGAPPAPPLRQKGINRDLSDRLPTSWNPKGHHFFIWDVMAPRVRPARCDGGGEGATKHERAAADVSPSSSLLSSRSASPVLTLSTSESAALPLSGRSRSPADGTIVATNPMHSARARLEPKRAIEQRKRFMGTPLLPQTVSEVRQCGRVGRIDGEGSAQVALGLLCAVVRVHDHPQRIVRIQRSGSIDRQRQHPMKHVR